MRDRTGEELDDEEQDPAEPDRHLCVAGWLGEDAEGRPRPCRTCKPHLTRPRTSGRAQ